MEYVLQKLRELEVKFGDRIFFQAQDEGVFTSISGEFNGADALGVRIDDEYYLGINIDSETIEHIQCGVPEST